MFNEKLIYFIGVSYISYYAVNILYDIYSNKNSSVMDDMEDESIDIKKYIDDEEPINAERIYVDYSEKEDSQDLDEMNNKLLQNEDIGSVEVEIDSQDKIKEMSNVTVHGGFSVNMMSALIKNAVNNPDDNPFVGMKSL